MTAGQADVDDAIRFPRDINLSMHVDAVVLGRVWLHNAKQPGMHAHLQRLNRLASDRIFANPASRDPALFGCLKLDDLVPIWDQSDVKKLLEKTPKVGTVALDRLFAFANSLFKVFAILRRIRAFLVLIALDRLERY